MRGSLPPSCCAENAENAGQKQQWGGTSRRNFRAILKHPKVFQPSKGWCISTFGHGFLFFRRKGICWVTGRYVIYAMQSRNIMQYSNTYTHIHIYTNIFIYTQYIFPRLSTLWMVISDCNPLCILGFPDCQLGMESSHIEEAGWCSKNLPCPAKKNQWKSRIDGNQWKNHVFFDWGWSFLLRLAFFGLLMLSLLEHGTLTISSSPVRPGHATGSAEGT